MIVAARVSWVMWAAIAVMLILDGEPWIVAVGVMVMLALVAIAPFLWTGRS